ncbi:MAG: beta-ketoacyl-[acyl-carrier-protein] synthase family protein [Pseudomonadota bacterium]|nr:beta-ketoacyl-[acyl-carrier-protein] synthase family protein [Pseudomonadota bacterium]
MDVAITGVGVISSIGLDIDTFNDNLSGNRPKIAPSPWSNEPEFENIWVSWIDDFDAERWMAPQVVAGTDPFAQFAIAATDQAIRSAGFETPPDPNRTAIVMGTAMAGAESMFGAQEAYDKHGIEGIPRKFQLMAWPNMAAGQIAMRYRLHGPLLTISTACASSLDAVGHAARMIASGQCDYAIAGGTDAGGSRLQTLAAGLFRMLTREPESEKACRPFDVERYGIMLGEGSGVVFLERADIAEKRGATIHGRIRGYASLSDAYHISSPDPTATWEIETMRRAIAEADLDGGEKGVDAVVAHGTGTQVGDTAEILAINEVFGSHAPNVRVTSIKGHVGHTGGAAGVMGILAGLHAMRSDGLPPTANTQNLEAAIRFQVPLGTPGKGPIRAVQVNGFGFGGQDASIVIARE